MFIFFLIIILLAISIVVVAEPFLLKNISSSVFLIKSLKLFIEARIIKRVGFCEAVFNLILNIFKVYDIKSSKMGF